MKGLHTRPAEPSRRVHGGRSWAAAAEGSSLALHSLILATPTANAPQGWKLIHLAQPALHRLGTEEAASKGRPEKQRWREAEAAPAGHISGPGAGRSMDVSVQWDLGRGGTKQPNSRSGVCLGLQREGSVGCSPRTHRGLPHQIKILEIKKEFERFGPKHPLSSKQVPAELCQP